MLAAAAAAISIAHAGHFKPNFSKTCRETALEAGILPLFTALGAQQNVIYGEALVRVPANLRGPPA